MCIKPLRSDLIYEGIFFVKNKKVLKNINKTLMFSTPRIWINITNFKNF